MADAKLFSIVDGPSLHNAMYALRVGVYDYDVLAKILTEEIVPNTPCFGKPVYVLPPDIAASREKRLRNKFEIVPMPSDGSDDEEIRKRILALDPTQVSKIILVTSDLLDFKDCLAQKIAQGIKVYIVATKEPDHDGRSRLTINFDKLIQEMGIEFVEIKPYRDRLCIKEALENRGRKEKPPVSVRVVKLSFAVEEGDFKEVMAFVASLSGDSRLSKFVLEVKKG